MKICVTLVFWVRVMTLASGAVREAVSLIEGCAPPPVVYSWPVTNSTWLVVLALPPMMEDRGQRVLPLLKSIPE